MKTGEEAEAPAEEAAPVADVLAGDTEQASAGGDTDSTDPDNARSDSDVTDGAGSDEADGAGSDEEAKPSRPAGAPIWLAAMIVLVALLIAGVVTTAGYLSRVHADNAQASSRAAAIAVARTAATDLTTASYQDPRQYVERLKPLAAGNFLSLFTNSASGFEDVLTEGKVQTTGTVEDIGVQRMGSGTAQLTALVYVTVKNSQTPKGSQRVYRLTISMIESGSQWLVSNVVFVQ